ncbi:hypothetical protein DM860_006885 [Cuscuta australis]|uniref:Uncharacterized protein n=1 Tax=Cuscuta australis TaxID=267555 RepID=A0A328E9I8_9ASTE|nr:hypothetical protein DM860_006885 [Cuscuta australis]
MAESFTDKMIDIYHRDHPRVEVKSALDKGSGHVLVTESSEGENRDLIFSGKAKGVPHFHRTVLTGTLTHPEYAPNGRGDYQASYPEGIVQRGTRHLFVEMDSRLGWSKE